MRIDYSKPIEIAPNIFWVGYNISDAWFHTNSYLIIEGKEAVLIDPGSQVDYKIVNTKVSAVLKKKSIKKISTIILHHQDPDLCGSTCLFEKGNDLGVYTPERSAVFMKFYGIKSFVTPISTDGEIFEFKTGRRLKFYLTPYCHSPGAMITYDEKNMILFSSDIFGAFNNKWELYVDQINSKTHLDSMKRFMEPFMASNQAMNNTIKKMEKLDIKMICPQHGSIIRKDTSKWINELKKMKFGTASSGKTGLEIGILKKIKKK